MGKSDKNESGRHWSDRHIWQFPFVRDQFWIAMGIGLILFGYYLRAVFTPVLIALALAYLCDPLITYAEEKWGWRRPVTITGLLSGLGLILIIVGVLLGSTIIGQTRMLIQNSPRYAEEISELIERAEEIALEDEISDGSETAPDSDPNSDPDSKPEPESDSEGEREDQSSDEATEANPAVTAMDESQDSTENAVADDQKSEDGASSDGGSNQEPTTLASSLKNLTNEFRDDPMAYIMPAARSLMAGSGQIAGAMQQVFGTAMYVLISLALIPIYFFFFAWHLHPMYRVVDEYIPESHKPQVHHILGRMDRAVASFFRDRVIISFMCGVLSMIGFGVTGVPYWFFLGLAFGILSLIPYAPVLVWPVAILLAYLNTLNGGDAAGTAEAADAVAESFPWIYVFVLPSAVYFGVQAIENFLLTPWIQGKSMEMSAVTILIVVFIGGALGGLYGMLLCIPVAACIKILLNEICLPRLREWADAH